MNDLEKLINELEAIITDEASTSLDVRGSYIIGAILRKDWDLYDSSTTVQDIDSYAGDLETRNGTDEQLEYAWQEIKRLTQVLKDRQKMIPKQELFYISIFWYRAVKEVITSIRADLSSTLMQQF